MPDHRTCEGANDPPPMAQLSTAGSIGLESLPNELLMTIIEELGTKENRKGWNSKSAVRSGYHGLCLVSKRIHLVARPYLFKKISLPDFRSVVRLCRTLAGDEHLAEGISEMRLTLDFRRMTKRHHIPLTPAEKDEVYDDCELILGPDENPRGANRHCDLIGAICYRLLARAVNLCSLTMVVEPSSSHWAHLKHQYHSVFFGLVSGAIRSAANGSTTLFLPLLQNLTLESRRRDFGCEVLGHFLGLPSLSKIRSLRDDGNWLDLVRYPDATPGSIVERVARRNIVSLGLYNSCVCQDDLEGIAQSFPSLQVLSVHTMAFALERRPWPLAIAGLADTSYALGKLTAIQKLKIDFGTLGPFTSILFYNYIVGSLGPGKVLSLERLPSLRHVEVPLFMFAHVPPLLGSAGITAVPREVLPQALENLVLAAHQDCCYPDWRPGWDSMAGALEFLESLGNDLSSFRRLKKVTYCFRRNSSANPLWVDAVESQADEGPKVSPDGADEGELERPVQESTRSRIQAIHATFAKQHVKFRVQETISKTKQRTIDIRRWE